MKKIFSHSDRTFVAHIQNILENHGIKTQLKNEHTSSALNIPIIDSLELWINDEVQFEEATEILNKAINNPKDEGKPWICTNCKEEIENQFTECWSCGKSK